MRLVFYRRVLRGFFSSLLLFPASLNAAENDLPLLKTDGQVYAALRISSYTADEDQKMMDYLSRQNDRYLSAVKSSSGSESQLDAFFEKGAAGSLRTKLGDFHKSVEDPVYKQYLKVGPRYSLLVDYVRQGRQIAWREDFECEQVENCKRATQMPGQLFEYAYSSILRKEQLQKKEKDLLAYLSGLDEKKLFSLGLDGQIDESKKQDEADFQLAIGMETFSDVSCDICDVNDFTDDERLLLQRFISLYQKAKSQGQIAGNSDFLKQVADSMPPLTITEGIPTVSWDTGNPRLVFSNIGGYLLKLINSWETGKPLGFLKDGEYAYLVFLAEKSSDKSDDFEFAIYILKRGESGVYELSPNGSRELNSRSLVFSAEFLTILKQFIAQEIR